MKLFLPVRLSAMFGRPTLGRQRRRAGTVQPSAETGYDCVVIGAFKYPAGDASSNRMLSLAKTLAATGRRPLVINDSLANPQTASIAGSVSSYHGIDYVCLTQGGQGPVGRLVHRCTRPIRILRALRALGPIGADIGWISVASGLYTPGLHFALHFMASKKTISDIVERHDPGQFQHGLIDLRFWRHRWTSWVSERLADRVIVVSSALHQRYSARRPVLVLPPAVDGLEYGPRCARDMASDRISLLYIGTPGKKDLLGVLLDAVRRLDAAERQRIRLVIAGPSRNDLILNDDVDDNLLAELDELVDIVGPVPRRRVYDLLAAADFTFLFRPPGGYADAGFPSKIPESLAAGCPVMVNLTSDLGRFLNSGADSLICTDIGIDEILRTLRCALELSSADLLCMSSAARSTAMQQFDYRIWARPLDGYLRFEST